ncbi:MAG: hypothetical protein MJZ51_01880 [Bacteroidales bacterium]|nr:hypothetical protein [Bacteroidales bacterium]
MKHVFSVSSHLTFYISKRIADLDNIAADDCIFILLRNYHIPEQYYSRFPHQIGTSYNVDQKTGRVFAGRHIMQTNRNIREFDELVDPYLGGEDFIFYTQVCSNDITSLMVTKSNCRGFYVIEDGFPSYLRCNPQTFTGYRYWIYKLLLCPIWRRLFDVKNHFISSDHKKFLGCIATQQSGFPMHQDCLRVVGIPFEKTESDSYPDAIISVDPLYNVLSNEQVDDIYAKVAAFMEQFHYQKVAYKMHPRFDAPQNTAHRQVYLDMLHRHFGNEIEQLPASAVLENMINAHPSDFYSLSSSVSIYASQMGAKCFSYMNLLEGTPAYNQNWIIEASNSPIV